ncbi:hypothetical protein KZC51_04465 [Microbacterium sp. SSW1-49]|uniref:Uncharacterized protein n=1 Tax=Microbacterium croceum TaxID=2851645 RepID=A0ABT0FCH5_9MICO|nr:hypothetical protein [Microbacterium croceum]MCK2035384.1 hypothetical protein [Microbacterium croceum]
MTAVELFYDDLYESETDFTGAVSTLQFDVPCLRGDDPGVETPIGRYPLKVELNRRMDELYDASSAYEDAGMALAEALSTIRSAYSALDEELSGEDVG